MIKPKRIVSTHHRTTKGEAAGYAAALFSTTMKKFIFFILVLSMLIVAEYYFLTECFTHKRVPVIAVSLMVVVACLYGLTRFFKKSFISS